MSWKVIKRMQIRNDGVWDLSSSRKGSGTWSNPGCIWKTSPARVDERLNTGCERKSSQL